MFEKGLFDVGIFITQLALKTEQAIWEWDHSTLDSRRLLLLFHHLAYYFPWYFIIVNQIFVIIYTHIHINKMIIKINT